MNTYINGVKNPMGNISYSQLGLEIAFGAVGFIASQFVAFIGGFFIQDDNIVSNPQTSLYPNKEKQLKTTAAETHTSDSFAKNEAGVCSNCGYEPVAKFEITCPGCNRKFSR